MDEYNYVRTFGKRKGVSAMLRIKNEADNIVGVLTGIKDIFDEICIVDNNSDDGTVDLIQAERQRCSVLNDKIRLFNYPFTVARCGDENFSTPADSVHSLAYYYNWCLSKCQFSYVWKWDGDMFLPLNFRSSAVRFIKDLVNSKSGVGVAKGVTVYKGLNGKYYYRPSKYEGEPHLFPNTPLVTYEKDILWERIHFDYEFRLLESDGPVFVELKDVGKNEFSHWSNHSLAWGMRKVREFEDFNIIKEGTGSLTQLALLTKNGFIEFDFSIY